MQGFVLATVMSPLTNKLNEKAAVVDQSSLTMNFDVHLHKHLRSVQMADEEQFRTFYRHGGQWARLVVSVSVQAEEDGNNPQGEFTDIPHHLLLLGQGCPNFL